MEISIRFSRSDNKHAPDYRVSFSVEGVSVYDLGAVLSHLPEALAESYANTMAVQSSKSYKESMAVLEVIRSLNKKDHVNTPSRRPEGVEPKKIRRADFAMILNMSELSRRRRLRYLEFRGLVGKEIEKTGDVMVWITEKGRAVVSSALQAAESKTPPDLETSCLHLLCLLAWALDR